MKTSPLSTTDARRIVSQWAETGRVLARLRREALARQSAEESQQAAWDMLQLGGLLPEDPKRATSSGLVEMQRLFAKLRRRG